MKKILLSAALASIVGFAAVAPQSAQAYDGKLTINGKINDSTCVVTPGNGASGTAGDVTVTMPEVQKAALAAKDAVAGEQAFTLTIGGPGQSGCTNGMVAQMTFDKTNVNAAGRLNNTGNATNVDVELANAAGAAAINLLNNAQTPQITIANNTAQLNYVARYHATGVATVGSVSAVANYSVTYN
ncbi:fimbrial protein [Dyella sp. ASV21]|uniref:fimbrial protein n=1 Tax=Dyella sp. ASV21 TaxID=2795114 RepID=UPI0018EC3D31|nr:fimbrial protein [Dyella sp. ASV21]